MVLLSKVQTFVNVRLGRGVEEVTGGPSNVECCPGASETRCCSRAFTVKSVYHSAMAALLGGFITDIKGIKVGHFTDVRRPTGCTVVLCEEGAVASVDVRGASPGTRETDLLDPVNKVEQAHAILLAGGSAFGLDAAGGVMRYLEE